MKKNTYLGLGILGLCTLSVVGAYSLSYEATPQKSEPHDVSISVVEPRKVYRSHSEYEADFSNPKLLVGGAFNVFAGKVIAETGKENLGRKPSTQFSVAVLHNIKGDLTGTVTITQDGRITDDMVLISDGDMIHPGGKYPDAEYGGYFLQPGSTYLFVTRGPNESGWHRMSSFPKANSLISDNVGLSEQEQLTVIQDNQRVKLLEVTYPDEILLQVDVEKNRVVNAFNLLPPEEKAAAQARADAARAALEASGVVQ